MKYKDIRQAVFLKRLNRFTAEIDIDGKTELCHVKNTGRLVELLIFGAKVYVQVHNNPERKTKYSLIAVEKGGEVVNIDSQMPNKVFCEWVREGHFTDGITLIKPEKTYGKSRFDCYIEAGSRKIFVEVKGVTLEKDGRALFPDAPTERGVKHLRELCTCVKDGYEAYIIFVVQMKGVYSFSPNEETHREFAQALYECKVSGVNILCVDCIVCPDSIVIDKEIEVNLILRK